MSSKRIMFDVDGVLADFVLGFTGVLYTMGLVPKPYGTHEQTTWDFALTKDETAHAWHEAMKGGDFWENLSSLVTPKEWAQIANMAENREVYFVTSRIGVTNAKAQTERWLKRHGVDNPSVVVTPKKGEFALLLGVDHAVDDKAGNAVYTAYHSPKTTSWLIDRGYNRFDHTVVGSKVKRFHEIQDFIDAIHA